MYKCNYCGRYLKKKYDTCPGCGGNNFSKEASYTTKVIKEPPEGGYKINFNNYNIKKNEFAVPKWTLIIIFTIEIAFIAIFFKVGVDLIKEKELLGGLIFLIISIIFIISTIISAIKMIKPFKTKEDKLEDNMDKIKTLKTKGILIKNLPYELKVVNKKQVGKKTYYIHVIYEIEKGHTLSLKSEPKYTGPLGREDGTVDVLIDPNDYSNYYIDFEIY